MQITIRICAYHPVPWGLPTTIEWRRIISQVSRPYSELVNNINNPNSYSVSIIFYLETSEKFVFYFLIK
jgi:hypothetical protein